MPEATAVAFHFNAPDKLRYACKLARKLQRLHQPLLVLAEPELGAQLDAALWAFGGDEQFLPHCSLEAAPEVLQRSPTVIASALPAGLPHQKVLLNLSQQMPADFQRFARVIEVVSADDQADRQLARERWRSYAALGYAIERHDLVLKNHD